jgi:hypothetical protein
VLLRREKAYISSSKYSKSHSPGAFIENGRGMENPEDMAEGYVRVVVRLQTRVPLLYPYP